MATQNRMLYYPVPTDTDMMRLNSFELVIQNTAGTVDFNMLRVMCKSVTVQQPNTNVINVNWMGGVYQLAGKASAYSFNASFYVGVNSSNTYDTLSSIYAWRNQVFNHKTGQIALAENYKMNADIFVYDVTGGQWDPNGTTDYMGPQSSARYVYKADGIWPTSIQDLNLSVESDGPMEISVTFAADKVYMDI